MRKLFSIAMISVLQGIRAQIFWIASLLCAFLLGIAFILRVLTLGEKEFVLRSICLSSMEISALLLIVTGFTYGFYRERESRLTAIYLTYVSKTQYLMGKLIGICLIIFLYLGFTSGLSSGLLYSQNALHWSFFLGGYSIFLKLCMLCSFCLFFSCLFESPVVAALVTVFSAIAGEFSSYSLSLVSSAQNSGIVWFYRIIYHLLPNMDKVDLKYQAIYCKTVSVGYVGEVTLYAFAYTFMIASLSLWIFSKREH
jgi:ABC-type transport system involved in multi-copper enzyme maturation permease subunit